MQRAASFPGSVCIGQPAVGKSKDGGSSCGGDGRQQRRRRVGSSAALALACGSKSSANCNILGGAQPAASLPARAANSLGLFRELAAAPPSPMIASGMMDRMHAPRRSTEGCPAGSPVT